MLGHTLAGTLQRPPEGPVPLASEPPAEVVSPRHVYKACCAASQLPNWTIPAPEQVN
jgi:hypothetical protein